MLPIHAAGGVLWRTAAGGPQVCLVHRPRYDDWSLPKGKRKPGEHPLAAAVREVREETGVQGVPQLRLPTVHYLLPGDIPKRVDFWSMRAGGGEPAARDGEADAVDWLAPAEAAHRVSYAEDARVLRHFMDVPPVTSTLALVRHAHAGRRGAYPGPDAERPLDSDGRGEARALAELLTLCRPERLVSAAPRRCVQTLEPLGATLRLAIEVDAAFDEPAEPEQAVQQATVAAHRLRRLAGGQEQVVVCSQGKLMPALLHRLTGNGTAGDYRTRKGTGWLLAFAGPTLLGLDPIVPAEAAAVTAPARGQAWGGRGLDRPPHRNH